MARRNALVLLIAGILLASMLALRAWQPEPASGPGAAPPPTTQPAPVPEPAPHPHPTPAPPPPPEPMVLYTGPVEHIFFHPLVAYPKLAFDGDSLAQGYDDWFVTIPEFKRIIDQLYRNQYILISINDLFTQVDGKLGRQELRLPAGKKPLVLSIDDLNYYEYMRQNGNVFKLVLNEQGEVRTYSVTPDGQSRIAVDDEIIPILDAFVTAHPDFALHGAKGMSWLDEVGSLVGPTFVYVYPFGSSVEPGTVKFQALLDAGFRLICTIGPAPYLAGDGRYMVMDRRHIDGMALRTQGRYLAPLFDADTVIDHEGRL